MKKILFVLAGLLIAAVALAAAAKDAPEKAMIDACKAKKSGVEFPHKAHVDKGLACDKCHHTQKGLKAGATDEVKKCSSCHLDPKDKALSCKEMSPAKNPYHKLCIDCHKAEKKGPAKCAECHK
jgi:hypothetical protein